MHAYSPSTAQAGRSKGERPWSPLACCPVEPNPSERFCLRNSGSLILQAMGFYLQWDCKLQDHYCLRTQDGHLNMSFLDAEGERPGIMKEQLNNAMLWKRGPRITSKLLSPSLLVPGTKPSILKFFIWM